MFATIAFSITLLGIFSIFEITKGNQKFSLLKYYILARLIIITTASGLDYLGFSGNELPFYKEIFKITALLVTVNLLFLQRALVGNFPNVSGSYWSSTEYFRSDLVDSYKLAWYQNFITGAQAYLDKKVTWSVRAIRAF